MPFAQRAIGPIVFLALLIAHPDAPAQALVRMPDGGNSQSIQAADPPPAPKTPEEEARLIDSYTKEAGTLGPRKWFSTAKAAFRATVGEAYDDNILVSAGSRKESDAVTTLAAGLGISVGDFKEKHDSYATVDYQATTSLFGIHGEEDAVDHAALADLQYRWDKLTTRVTSTYQSLHETSADLGGRVQRSVYDEALDAQYYAGAYTRIEGAVRYNLSDYDTTITTQDLSGLLGADYLFFDKLRLGGQITGGRLSASQGVRETYEQIQARVEYEVSGQIQVRTRFGVELRQREGGGEGDTAIPVFSLEGLWNPFDGTALDLNGFRRVTASASLAGDDILETGLHFSLRQRLVTRFYAQLDGEYTHAEYQRAVDSGSSLPRTDDYYLVRLALGYDFVDWLKVQLFCQRREDDSTLETFSFDSTRTGVQVDLAY